MYRCVYMHNRIYMYVGMFVCIFVCKYICMCVRIYVCMCLNNQHSRCLLPTVSGFPRRVLDSTIFSICVDVSISLLLFRIRII